MPDLTFKDICKHLAARYCYADGQSVEQIAQSAKVSPATVRYWLSQTDHIAHRFRKESSCASSSSQSSP